MSSVSVVGSVFTTRGCDGDFGWMIEQPEYEDTLFVFNDNEEQFLAHLEDPTSSFGCSVGGGNAVIRPYRCRQPPRSAGIPTGVDGQGYNSLNSSSQRTIDLAIEHIQTLLSSGNYHRVIFSSDGDGGLGTGIFEVDSSVKDYIVQSLRGLDSCDAGQ